MKTDLLLPITDLFLFQSIQIEGPFAGIQILEE